MTDSSLAPLAAYSLPFVEPHTTTLFVVGSFLYLLNVIHGLFQFLFDAGLVGQLILGVVYCLPLGNILPIDIQTSIGTLGYWGLLLLIVEGGLGTRFDLLSKRENATLCILVALSGICFPIGFSMVVLYFGYQYTVLEAFIIGAALSVTSLGTTIAIMSSLRPSTPTNDAPKGSSDIGETRAATILLGAAVIDDIPGLVISSVVANLGSNSKSQLSAWVIARPIRHVRLGSFIPM